METLITFLVCAMAFGFGFLVVQFLITRQRYADYLFEMYIKGLPQESFEGFVELERRYGKYVKPSKRI